MRKYALKKNNETGEIPMSVENLKICAQNQEGYETLYLNDSLQLQYCNFAKIQNLQQCICSQITGQSSQNKTSEVLNKQTKGVNTLFLNNNIIDKIQNLDVLSRTLVTINLSNNRITHFSGLKQLSNLAVLDLSHNKIRKIQKQEISPLINLKRLNLNSNLLNDQSSIEAIVQLQKNLETLELASNESFQPELNILTEVFGQMNQLKILVLKETPFVRSTSAYRKQVILAVQSLNYLDDRPVSFDERFLAKAWKRGGLKEQQEARKMIRQKIDEKNHKILQEIEQRNKIVDNKAEKIFFIKAKQLINELQSLKAYKKSEDFELLTSEEQSVLELKIQQLERYLELFKEQCKSLDLDKQLGIKKQQLPKMLVQKRTNECIYIYNVSQQQLELIKQKYYPDQSLPLKAINYQKPKEVEWLPEYNPILERLYRILKGNWDLILPSFNLDIYEFDLNCGRKLRRFNLAQLKKYFEQINSESVSEKQGNLTYISANQIATPNPLDCLD